MKITGRVTGKWIRRRIRLDKIYFGLVWTRGMTDADSIVRQQQEKYLVKNKPLHIAYVDLEKAFVSGLCCVIMEEARG